MEVLSYSVSTLLFALILVETTVNLRARRAVPGSRERYVALTQRRVLSWVVNIGFAVQGLLGLIEGQTFSSISLLFAAYLSYVEIKNHHDDDDWFSGRGKKIWSGVKKAFAARMPAPTAAPAPAFG